MLQDADLLAEDVSVEDPFVAFQGGGLLYHYWNTLRRQGERFMACMPPADRSSIWPSSLIDAGVLMLIEAGWGCCRWLDRVGKHMA